MDEPQKDQPAADQKMKDSGKNSEQRSLLRALGSSFIYGYNLSVVNAPALYIKAFYNRTWMERYGEPLGAETATLLWSVTVSIFSIGGLLGAVSVTMILKILGRKGTLLLNNIFALIAVLLLSLVKVPNLLRCSSLVGSLSGYSSLRPPMYLGEITPRHIRGSIGQFNAILICFGVFTGQVLGLPELLGQKLTPATKKTADPAQRRIDETLSTFPPNSEKAKKITQSVAAFIAKDLRPYSVVENAGFRHLLKTLEPRYKLPSRSHFTENVIPALYNGTKAQVMASMIQAKRVAITCDAWTSVATESYLTVTAHYISEDWQFLSHVLQTRAVYESHTGAHVAELLSRVVEEWQLSDKDVVLVTDNASNMIAAAEFGKFPHVKCFAHTLNLASQRALKPMKDATTLMSEESNPTVSLIAPINAQLFQDMTGTIGDSPMIHAIKNAIKTDLLKRYNSEAEKKILHTASALDPRFKGLPFLTVEERLEVYRGVTEEAASLENERTLRRTEVTEAPEAPEETRWSYLFTFLALPAVLQLCVMPFLPETFQRLLGKKDVSQELEEVHAESRAQDNVHTASVLQLLRSQAVRWQLITIIVSMACYQLCGLNAVRPCYYLTTQRIWYYTNGILRDAGFADNIIPYITLTTGAIETLAAIISGLVIERIGRRPLLIFGFVSMAVFFSLLTVFLHFQDSMSWMPYLSYVCILASYRPAAFMIAGIVNWLCNFAVGLLFPFIQEALQAFAFLVFVVVCVLGSIYLYFVLPETKNKTFMDISQSFAKINNIPVPSPGQEMKPVLSCKPDMYGKDIIKMESSF
ncbi:hypothetical protein F7725_016757 [Dissostichus mawsoni]|uniref:Uncharacterized protein n=1 Tax=Dissostichus mawsoni TaxID=36200 RepID=A0A7J5Z2K4_DISMA|nr:hypothetical protein F7725_016757 [Dissostichus mawsoni]